MGSWKKRRRLGDRQEFLNESFTLNVASAGPPSSVLRGTSGLRLGSVFRLGLSCRNVAIGQLMSDLVGIETGDAEQFRVLLSHVQQYSYDSTAVVGTAVCYR